MKKVVTLMMTLVILSTILLMPVYAATFSDLETGHWAYEYITTLADSGVINGFDDGTYKPSNTVTRGQFIKLVMSSCIPSYIDLSEAEGTMDHWAADYVWIAEMYGVINTGDITEENIDEPITRIEMVRMVSNADMIMLGNSVDETAELSFIDIADLDFDDIYLLEHAVTRGLITGYTDGTFKPDKTMNRAEAATMIYRFTK